MVNLQTFGFNVSTKSDYSKSQLYSVQIKSKVQQN